MTPPAAAGAGVHDELLFFEVLARLPVQSLTRFKCVCRSWRAAIEDPAFARRHLEQYSRAGPPSVIIVPREHFENHHEEETSEAVSFHRIRPGTLDAALMLEKSWPGGVTHLVDPVHCDGLVALSTFTHQVFVCNRATKEFVELPPGSRSVNHEDLPTVSLGFHPWRGRYFVARYFYRNYAGSVEEPEIDIGHEIFTLGGGGEAGSWELTQDPPHLISPVTPVCTRDAIYWHGHVEVRPQHQLLRFSLRDETFDVASFPPGCAATPFVDMAELAGKLCLANPGTATAFDIWVADDVGSSVGFLMPLTARGDEIFMAVSFGWLGRYDMRSKVLEKVVDFDRVVEYGQQTCSPCSILHYVVPYVESLI